MKPLAPVILFVYNRPDHTLKTLDALSANILSAETELIVYADGAPLHAKKEELQKIESVKKIIHAEKRFKKVTIIISEKNKGLASSIVEGVTDVVSKYGKAIILEDDLVTSKYFLSFMNNALEYFENNDDVACISGYIYPTKENLPDLFFLKGADCWGWATWKKSWDLFEEKGDVLLHKLTSGEHSVDFNFYNTYPYIQMLKDQIAGKNKSWAVRWYASAYLSGKLTLYPGRSLVRNIGFDGTGIHSGRQSVSYTDFPGTETIIHPIPVIENTAAKKQIAAYFKSSLNRKFRSVLKRKINYLLKKIQGN